MRGSDTTYSTHNLRAEGELALREGHLKTAGLGTQMQRLAFLCSGTNGEQIQWLAVFLLSHRCLFMNSARGPVKRPNLDFSLCSIQPKADVKLQGNVQHFVSVEYAQGCFELVMRSCSPQTGVFNLCCGSENRTHFKDQETQGSYAIQN